LLVKSPLAIDFPSMPTISGATPRIARAGYKDWSRCDLTFIELDEGTKVAGVTTRNICCSPEVELCRENLAYGKARALVVNAGNSNAFTGYRGRETVDAITARVAAHLNCRTNEVFVSSTGVIGVPLPKDKAEAGLRAVFEAAPCSWEDATNTIGTTDTFAKGATASAVVGDRKVHLVGIIKGSGMIAPDMATMLGYIFTDAAIDATKIRLAVSLSIATLRPAIQFWLLPRAQQEMYHLHHLMTPVQMRLQPHYRIFAVNSRSLWCVTAKVRKNSLRSA
jgi:glutamate N-acetyltransferase / amino-acid N-acetyltransferase